MDAILEAFGSVQTSVADGMQAVREAIEEQVTQLEKRVRALSCTCALCAVAGCIVCACVVCFDSFFFFGALVTHMVLLLACNAPAASLRVHVLARAQEEELKQREEDLVQKEEHLQKQLEEIACIKDLQSETVCRVCLQVFDGGRGDL